VQAILLEAVADVLSQSQNVTMARIYSKYLALQIAAMELGLVPKNRPNERLDALS